MRSQVLSEILGKLEFTHHEAEFFKPKHRVPPEYDIKGQYTQDPAFSICTNPDAQSCPMPDAAQ